eukprot:365467-Chlamydomonas_euryale.AAC.24
MAHQSQLPATVYQGSSRGGVPRPGLVPQLHTGCAGAHPARAPHRWAGSGGVLPAATLVTAAVLKPNLQEHHICRGWCRESGCSRVRNGSMVAQLWLQPGSVLTAAWRLRSRCRIRLDSSVEALVQQRTEDGAVHMSLHAASAGKAGGLGHSFCSKLCTVEHTNLLQPGAAKRRLRSWHACMNVLAGLSMNPVACAFCGGILVRHARPTTSGKM